MPTTTLDNHRLFYTRTTPADGGPSHQASLVLIHGAMGSHLDWPAGLRRIAGATVYALDLPGHGRSEPPGMESVAAYAKVVKDFVTQVVAGPAVLVGHSMGGAIAQMVALAPPDALRGLVLIATGPRLRVSGAILDRLPAQASAVVDLLVRHYWSEAAPPTLVARSREKLLAASPEVGRGDFLACDGFDLRESLGEVRLPALILAADGDRLTPPSLARELADGLPDARLILIPGAGHMVMLEQEDEVVRAVATFVAEIAQAGA